MEVVIIIVCSILVGIPRTFELSQFLNALCRCWETQESLITAGFASLILLAPLPPCIASIAFACKDSTVDALQAHVFTFGTLLHHDWAVFHAWLANPMRGGNSHHEQIASGDRPLTDSVYWWIARFACVALCLSGIAVATNYQNPLTILVLSALSFSTYVYSTGLPKRSEIWLDRYYYIFTLLLLAVLAVAIANIACENEMIGKVAQYSFMILSLLHPRLAHSYSHMVSSILNSHPNSKIPFFFGRFHRGGGSNRERAERRLWWGQRKSEDNVSTPDHCV